jgi:hypothetical protein
MNDKVYCGNEEALISYLYDECAPGEREAIATHVSRCMSCAEEVQSLRLTRSQLTAWTPPGASLGFRITSEVSGGGPGPAAVLTSPRWWKQPLPAWAQIAAAVAIFAAGMTAGSSRGSAVDDRASSTPSAQTQAVPASVSRQDFDALRAEVSRLRSVTVPASGSVDDSALVRRVSSLVDQQVRASEARMRREFVNDTAQLVRDFQIIRAQDLSNVRASFDGFQRVTGEQLMQTRDAITRVNRVIEAGQVVPTSLR